MKIEWKPQQKICGEEKRKRKESMKKRSKRKKKEEVVCKIERSEVSGFLSFPKVLIQDYHLHLDIILTQHYNRIKVLLDPKGGLV